MKLVDLKLSEKKRKAVMQPPQPPGGDQYPWGFRLSFGDEEVKKFPGLEDCEAGQKVTIQAEAKIISRSEDANEERERCSIEMQITGLALDLPGKELNAPRPKAGESRADFFVRCVQSLKHESPSAPTKKCLEQCSIAWNRGRK